MDYTAAGARAALDPSATRALPVCRRLITDEIRYADSGVAPEDGTGGGRSRAPGLAGNAIRLEIAHEGRFAGHELPPGPGELAESRPSAAHSPAASGGEPAADDGYPGADVTGYAAGDPFAGYEEFAPERTFTRLSARPWTAPGRSWPAG